MGISIQKWKGGSKVCLVRKAPELSRIVAVIGREDGADEVEVFEILGGDLPAMHLADKEQALGLFLK